MCCASIDDPRPSCPAHLVSLTMRDHEKSLSRQGVPEAGKNFPAGLSGVHDWLQERFRGSMRFDAEGGRMDRLPSRFGDCEGPRSLLD